MPTKRIFKAFDILGYQAYGSVYFNDIKEENLLLVSGVTVGLNEGFFWPYDGLDLTSAELSKIRKKGVELMIDELKKHLNLNGKTIISGFNPNTERLKGPNSVKTGYFTKRLVKDGLAEQISSTHAESAHGSSAGYKYVVLRGL